MGTRFEPAGTAWEDHEKGPGGTQDCVGADSGGDGEEQKTDGGIPDHGAVCRDEAGERIGKDNHRYGEKACEGDLLYVIGGKTPPATIIASVTITNIKKMDIN